MSKIKMNLRNTICGTALLLLFFSAGQARAEGGINNMATPVVAPENFEFLCTMWNGCIGWMEQAVLDPGPAIPDELGPSFVRGTNINTLIRTNVNTIPPADGPL